MARRRTKKDKIIAQLRRQVQNSDQTSEATYSLSELPASPSSISSLPSSSMGKDQDTFLSLFAYDPAFIQKDLLRTAALTFIAFTIEFCLYFWLR